MCGGGGGQGRIQNLRVGEPCRQEKVRDLIRFASPWVWGTIQDQVRRANPKGRGDHGPTGAKPPGADFNFERKLDV